MSKRNYKQSTKELSKHQETGSKSLIVLVFIGVAAFATPFIHIFSSKEKNEFLFNALGFTSYSTLLFAIGFPILVFCLGFFFYIIGNSSKSYDIKLFSRFIGFSSQLVSLFFIVWALFPTIKLKGNDFPKYLYMVFSFIIAGLLSITFYWLYKYFTNKESRFTKAINYILYNRVETVIPMIEEEDMIKRAEIASEHDDELKDILKDVY